MKGKLLYLKWRHHKMRSRVIRAVCSRLYRDTNRDIKKSIIVAGTARSGTTWLADIISSQIPCRIMFEPFHSRLVEAFREFNYFQYMRPQEKNDELLSYCQKIFTGHIRHKWIDRQIENFFPSYRLIKEIRANLFLKWIHNRFPEIPIFFMMRNPYAVVLSRMKLAWATDTDIDPFLSQPALVDDFLADAIETIRRAKSVEEKHAVIWCVSNLVPLKQFNSNGINVFFYENLCLRPEVEIPRIFEILNQEYNESVFARIEKPSTTATSNSAIVSGGNKVRQWKEGFSYTKINNIRSVVKAFELDHIYGDSVTPLVTTL
jgi:hypothetical protein